MLGSHTLIAGILAISAITDDTDLATAVHRWFDTQVSDHGEHAHGS